MMFFLQSEQFNTALYCGTIRFRASPLPAPRSKYYNINEKGKNHVITLTLPALLFIILIRNVIYCGNIPAHFMQYGQTEGVLKYR